MNKSYKFRVLKYKKYITIQKDLLDLITELDQQIEMFEPDEHPKNIEQIKNENKRTYTAFYGVEKIIKKYFPKINIEQEIINREFKNKN